MNEPKPGQKCRVVLSGPHRPIEDLATFFNFDGNKKWLLERGSYIDSNFVKVVHWEPTRTIEELENECKHV